MAIGFKYIIEIFSVSLVLFCLVLIDCSVCGGHTWHRSSGILYTSYEDVCVSKSAVAHST